MAFGKSKRFKDERDRSRSPQIESFSTNKFNKLPLNESLESGDMKDQQIANLMTYKELKARKNTIDL